MNEIALTNSVVKETYDLFCLPSMRTQEGLLELEKVIDEHPLNLGIQAFPVYHHFAAGTYSREIHLKRGYMLTGWFHRKGCVVHMLCGKILVASEDGVKLLEGPLKFDGMVGKKKVGLILEDSVWIDTYATDKTTVREAEEELFYEKPDDAEATFESMLAELGVTPEEVRQQSENKEDLIDFPERAIIEIKESVIEGQGAFLTEDVPFRGTIGTARVGFNRTPLGRYTNHSFIPNAKAVVEGDAIYFEARGALSSGEEVTVDYRDARAAAFELDRRKLT